jgi:hypothetical protein
MEETSRLVDLSQMQTQSRQCLEKIVADTYSVLKKEPGFNQSFSHLTHNRRRLNFEHYYKKPKTPLLEQSSHKSGINSDLLTPIELHKGTEL